MTRNLFYTALGLMGLMGTLVIGVVNASNFVTTVPGLVVTGEQDGQTFEYGVLKFNDGSGHVIMLLDRNLGATMTGAGADANTGSYGFKYQWGNNYGFADGCWTAGCSDSVAENATGTLAIWNPDYDNSNYSGNIFIKSNYSPNDYWSDSTNSSGNHTNLRGGGNDSQNNNWGIDTMSAENIKNRQGPCPEGYHVPSIGERNNLAMYWHNAHIGTNIIGGNLYDFREQGHTEIFEETFFLPIANFRQPGSQIAVGGTYSSYLWSSSPLNTYSHCLYIGNGALDSRCNVPRSLGLPIRCFYDAYLFPYKYSFMNGDTELKSGSIISGERIIDIINLSEFNTTKEGYHFNYWYIQGEEDTEFDFTGTVITGNITLYAKQTAKEYLIKYELDGGTNSENNLTGYTIEDSITFANPTKEGFTFDGWFTDAQFTTGITSISTGTTGPITVYAKWTENKKSSGSSGGGGRSRSSNTQDSSTSSQNDKNTENVIQSETKGSEESSKTPMDSSDKSSEGQSQQQFTQEFQEAYEFAKEKGITTMPTINEANMNGKLTRIAMAKMLSYYAINVIGQKPDETRNNKFNDITDKLDAQYDSGVTLAYQLGIMGINMPDNKFRPDDEVTRAEFATALSRMLYSTPDGKPYYTTHLEKLKSEKILTNDDYKMKELRGYVMIMLKRSAK